MYTEQCNLLSTNSFAVTIRKAIYAISLRFSIVPTPPLTRVPSSQMSKRICNK